MDDLPPTPLGAPHLRRIFANRTLNLRSIKAIGYDMDYTLIHYRVEEWERRAFESLRERLAAQGWPVEGLQFDASLTARGLVIDIELGNTVKANRFGYVVKAFHGTVPLEFEAQRRAYARTLVDLAERRWYFLNTLFSLSEGCMWAQLVELLDAGRLPGVLGYEDLHRRVRRAIDEAHVEGALKAAILADPERFVEVDDELALALADHRAAGKRLMLVTNSEWEYVQPLMSFALDRFLPAGGSWRELFEVVISSSRKPEFFARSMPLLAVDHATGLLRPCPLGIPGPGVYVGGDAAQVEEYLGLSGEEILYVGDHVFADVHVSKDVLRWRTALVLRELEEELAAQEAFDPWARELAGLMAAKERVEAQQCAARVALQRRQAGYGPPVRESVDGLKTRLASLREEGERLDERIAPLAQASARVLNPHWGTLMRAGSDKSLFARQVERSADVYTSRVSNFLLATPFAYLRAHRGSLPHDAA